MSLDINLNRRAYHSYFAPCNGSPWRNSFPNLEQLFSTDKHSQVITEQSLQCTQAFVEFFKALVFKVWCQDQTANSWDYVADLHSWLHLDLMTLTYRVSVIHDCVTALLGTM